MNNNYFEYTLNSSFMYEEMKKIDNKIMEALKKKFTNHRSKESFLSRLNIIGMEIAHDFKLNFSVDSKTKELIFSTKEF